MSQANAMLDELERFEAPRGCTPVPAAGAPKPAIQKLNYSHDAMIDLIISNPGIHQNHLGEIFGYSPSWISTVMATDSFKARLAERRTELVDPALIEQVKLQFEGVVRRSLDILMQKLAKPAEEVSDQTCLRALELGSRALGYGAAPPTQVNVQVNVDGHLEEMGNNLTKLLQRKKEEALAPALPVPMEDDENG